MFMFIKQNQVNINPYDTRKSNAYLCQMQSFVSFDMVHVFKTLQLIEKYGHVSRERLCDELKLGEGATR